MGVELIMGMAIGCCISVSVAMLFYWLEDIPMSRRQRYIVELADGSFYWFGGGKGMGFHTCSKFIYHLRKNQQKWALSPIKLKAENKCNCGTKLS